MGKGVPLHGKPVFRKPFIVSFGIHGFDQFLGEEALLGKVEHGGLRPLPVENRLESRIC